MVSLRDAVPGGEGFPLRPTLVTGVIGLILVAGDFLRQPPPEGWNGTTAMMEK